MYAFNNDRLVYLIQQLKDRLATKEEMEELNSLLNNHTHTSLLATALAGQTVSLNNYNCSTGTPVVQYFYCPTNFDGAYITGRPDDDTTTRHAFLLRVESIRWADANDYITKQTYIQGSTKKTYTRFCTNGTWSTWALDYNSVDKQPDVAKLTTPRTITIGNTGKTFDGSANVSWTLSEIGAMPHSTITETNVDLNTFNTTGMYAIQGNLENRPAAITTACHCLLIVEAHTGTKFQLITHDMSKTFYRRYYDYTAQIWTEWSKVIEQDVKGNLEGNASTATKLQTARTINGVSFDGSSNIEVPTILTGADGTKYQLVLNANNELGIKPLT